MTDLTDLITRVEGATGPDRELDLDIAIALGLAPTGERWERRNGYYNQGGQPYLRENQSPNPGPWPRYEAPPFSRSLDAALGLAERVLPGAGIMLNIGSVFEASVWPPKPATPVSAVSRSPALALVLAVLRARVGSSVADIAAACPADCAATVPQRKSEGTR